MSPSSSHSTGCVISSATPKTPTKDGGRNLAYALYVLARNGAAPVGDLRYFADTKLDAIATPIAKAQIAAALGMLGDRARAERVYAAALAALAPRPVLDYGRSDYGSVLRDAAALVTLASEGSAQRATITGAVERVEAARGLTPYTSTQENAWMVLAARALVKDAQTVTLDVGGEKTQGVLNRNFRPGDLQQPLKVTQCRRWRGAGRRYGSGGPGGPGTGGGEGLQDRTQILHVGRSAG